MSVPDTEVDENIEFSDEMSSYFLLVQGDVIDPALVAR